jgi:hypothetical protein
MHGPVKCVQDFMLATTLSMQVGSLIDMKSTCDREVHTNETHHCQKWMQQE